MPGVATLLVSDTSVLIDLDRGGILNAVFQLPYDIGVPDVLYHQELEHWQGPQLLKLGLSVRGLDGDGVALAQRYRNHQPRLSLPDAFALALAKTEGHILLAGDAVLRQLADIEEVETHGVLWVIDLLETHAILNQSELHAALIAIAGHPRCRLPHSQVHQRLKRYVGTTNSGG
jgi:hypothetical protein